MATNAMLMNKFKDRLGRMFPLFQVYEMTTTLEAELTVANEQVADSNGTGNGSVGPCTPVAVSPEIDCESLTTTDKSQSPFSNPTVQESANTMHSAASHALYYFKPTSEVCLLSYTQGDYVLLVGSCCPPGRQGCPLGVNLSTGAIGLFNLSTGRRIPQYRTWVLHR